MVKYYPHANGGHPFEVDVNTSQKTFSIYKPSRGRDNELEFDNVLIEDIKYHKIFVGEFSDKSYLGNTVLFCLNSTSHIYLFVGQFVTIFKTLEKIVHYESPVYGSDDPYPYAMSENYTYFPHDTAYYENTVELEGEIHKFKATSTDEYYILFNGNYEIVNIPTGEDAYHHFYKYDEEGEKPYPHKIIEWGWEDRY